MQVSELTSPDSISVGWPSGKPTGDKWKLLTDTIDFLVGAHQLDPRMPAEIAEHILAREHSLSTGIGENVALPHASLPRLQRACAAMVILKDGISFESIDRQPVKILVMLLVPKLEFEDHIRTMAGIARTLYRPEVRDSLVQADSPAAAYDLLLKVENGQL